jgi:pimeloyl-ACP methyl ester carboxylesterase
MAVMRRLSWLLVGAFLALLLIGCGPTIATRITSQPVRPVPEATLGRAQLRRDVRAIKRNDHLLINSRSFQAIDGLVLRAGTNSQRLAEAAAVSLYQAAALPTAEGEQRAGLALTACQIAWRSLRESGVQPSRWLTSEATQKALAIYNTALAMFVSIYSEQLAWGIGSLSVQTPLGNRIVTVRYSADGRYRSRYFDKLIPADYVAITGFRKRARVNGLGAPLVGVRERTKAREAELRFQPPRRGVFVPLGCLATFEPDADGSRMEMTLFDLDRTSRVRFGSEFAPLAGDFTAPLALSFEGINDLMVGIRAILNVGRSQGLTGIYLIEPFDPNRIPVLLIHGLSSSPLVWRNLATHTMKNPVIRKNFQFWYAFYSSGMLVPQSAALIRDRIAVVRHSGDPHAKLRASRNMVVVGYSMGGIIARIFVTDMGDRFWAVFTKKPFNEIQLEPEDRQELKRWIFWTPVPGIKEVVFLATPHRGTRMADASFAQLGRKLVGLPASLMRFQRRVLLAVVDVVNGVKISRRSFTGIDSLSPEAPIYKAFERAPFASGLVYHSVIGDRGRADSPESSDGVVGYWSTHLEGSKSELIVPTGHDVQTHSKTEAEIEKILLGYLSRNKPSAP